MSDHVTLAEAASYLGVSKATLRNWDRAGKLKATRHPVNDYRMYSLAELRELKSQLSLFEEGEDTQQEHKSTDKLSVRDVKKIIGRLHNAMRDTDANSSLIARFDELSKLLFLALHAIDNNTARSAIQSTNLPPNVYAEKIRKTYVNFCKSLPFRVPPGFAQVNCSDAAVHECGKTLSFVNFADADFDVKGVAYEEMIRRTFDKTDNQQFFTPNQIVSFMTQFYATYIDGDICDPASGTGGFLVEVAKSGKKYHSLTGFEIDERLAWVTGLNMYLHGGRNISSINLKNGGTLGRTAEKYYSSFDLILTNPPFGSDFSDARELDKYLLGRTRTARRRGILFIERCFNLLRPGGRMGIIIDEGVLNLSHAEDVREFIFGHFNVEGVVSLPESAFMPYATVNASILFMQRKESPSNRKVFFGRADRVGRKTNGDDDLIYGVNGGITLNSDLPKLLAGWKEKKKASKQDDKSFYWANVRKHFSADPDAFRLDFRFHHPSRDDSIRSLEASKFPLVALSDLCDERNVLLIPSKDLADTVILYTGLAHIEAQTGNAHQEPTAANSLQSAVRRYEPQDIVFARMRPNLRKVALMDFPEGGYVSPECVVLTPRKNDVGQWIIDPVLLSVALRSDLVYGQITHLIAGIGRPRLNISDLRKVRIPVPPPNLQIDIRLSYDKAQQAARTLRAQAARLQDEASQDEQVAVASLATNLAGQGKGL